MSWEPEPPKRREPFLWMLGGMALTLAFIAVAVMAYMFGAGIIGPSGATPTVLPSPVPPTPIPVSTVAKQGTGSLYLEYILDASGSMNEALPDGTVKLAVARDLLAQHLQAFLPETKIGLRAYGHRIDYQQAAESCQDIELIAPVETGSLPAIVGWLRGFEARGMTPLAESIRQATDDFLFEPDRINSIVMLSDGIETCEGDPCGLVRNLMVEGINFTIHVIGLDVDQPARDQLSCIAYTSGGTYHDARSEQELAKALAEIGNVLTQGQMVSPPDADTPPPEPDVTQVVLQTGTASLTPEPAPTEQASSTPQPPTPTTPPTATPLPPPPTPTVPARVLPKPIYYENRAPMSARGSPPTLEKNTGPHSTRPSPRLIPVRRGIRQRRTRSRSSAFRSSPILTGLVAICPQRPGTCEPECWWGRKEMTRSRMESRPGRPSSHLLGKSSRS